MSVDGGEAADAQDPAEGVAIPDPVTRITEEEAREQFDALITTSKCAKLHLPHDDDLQPPKPGEPSDRGDRPKCAETRGALRDSWVTKDPAVYPPGHVDFCVDCLREAGGASASRRWGYIGADECRTMRKLHQQGRTHADIAALLERTTTTVGRHVRGDCVWHRLEDGTYSDTAAAVDISGVGDVEGGAP